MSALRVRQAGRIQRAAVVAFQQKIGRNTEQIGRLNKLSKILQPVFLKSQNFRHSKKEYRSGKPLHRPKSRFLRRI